ncbi:MAG TPA: aminoglycoside phosphotransferase family protein [Micromonosporaceae bacterium]
MLTEDVRRSAEARGPSGVAWIESLPGIVAHLRDAWSLTIGESLPGGIAALVLRVRHDGGDAVLKIAHPDDRFADEVATLTVAAGRGYVRLLAADLDRNAALLEALGRPLAEASLRPEEQFDLLAATLIEAWRPAPPPDGRHPAAALADYCRTLWADLGGPAPHALLDRALEYGQRRLASDAPTVLCHGDPHVGNALAVPRPRPGAASGYVFVDPDGFSCEAAHDLGVTVRSHTADVLAAADPVALVRGWCDRLAAATGVDRQAIWEWGLFQRISTGLHLIRYGHPEDGRAHLASAERLLPG